MKLDFSTPEEAPEEFRAGTFSMPPAKKGMRMPSLTALEIQTQGMADITVHPDSCGDCVAVKLSNPKVAALNTVCCWSQVCSVNCY